ncbi:hypothetical protein LOTGIDRAFT_176446 [Lottia gigantea]|uniref:Apple domain-containing protein n=1 Tax=Lottia gigantea TaxID=225164 RepID=V4B215_LOTGI|nr:hypothetical protein LOTGIDRAFT_176446 [Lottia gigantea]ESP01551.1 hypothetical protein LOTGIDRAFT_176446 [Lottia gigantea]
MTGFVLSFILCLRAVHVVSECTKTFLFDTAFVDTKLTNYFETTTQDSKLDCSRRCQDIEYCTGFSYNPTSWRCELYDEVISTAKTELAAGTVTYKATEVCGPPPSIPNTNTQPADQYYLPGYLMLYDCLRGSYQNSSIVCLKEGSWNTSAAEEY